MGDLKSAARTAVSNAVREGRLVRPSVCDDCGGEGPIEGHHPDYAKPLDVDWLCKGCHGRRHRGPRGALNPKRIPAGFLTVAMAAERYGVSREVIRRLLKRRELTTYLRGGHMRPAFVEIAQADPLMLTPHPR